MDRAFCRQERVAPNLRGIAAALCASGKARLATALVISLLLALAVGGCGDSGSPSRTVPASSASSSRRALGAGDRSDDGDTDVDDSGRPITAEDDDDGGFLAQYGPEANSADRANIVRLLTRYYAAATATDGAHACSLLYGELAVGLGATRDPSRQNAGGACPATIARLFKQQHQALASETATMKTLEVHVNGDFGVAVLGFKTVPRSEILLKREGSVWKIDALLQSYMP